MYHIYLSVMDFNCLCKFNNIFIIKITEEIQCDNDNEGQWKTFFQLKQCPVL